MSQNSPISIENQGFPSFRADLNASLEALASTNSGATEPTTTYAHQMWYDTTTNLLKMRNTDNDAWITLAYFDQTNDEWEVRSAVIQAVDSAGVVIKTDDGTTRLTIADGGDVTVANDLTVNGGDMLLDSAGDSVFTMTVGGTSNNARIDFNNGTSVDGGITYDHDGSFSSEKLVLRAGNNTSHVYLTGGGNVGIGTSSPNAKLMVSHGNNAPNSSGNMTNGSVFSNSGTLSALQVGSSGDYSYLNSAYSNNSGVGVDLRIYNGGGSERMRINANGAVGINSTTDTAMLHINSSSGVSTSNAGLTNFIDQSNRISNYRHHNAGSFSSSQYLIYATRSNTADYSFIWMSSGAGADREFTLRGDGNAFADGSWNGGGADYAEYFEWADGNTSNEDRRGYTVVLDGNMIRKATDEDDASQIIGAVSATPCVIGDHADNKWSGKFLKDDFGNYIREEHNVVEWTEQELVEEAEDAILDEEGNVIQEAKEAVYKEKKHSYEDWNIPEGITVPDDAVTKTHDDNGNRFDHRKPNPDFDPDAEYITRENRPEWSPIGMMGKLRIRKGQPVGDRWIKMRDISDAVEEWLVR